MRAASSVALGPKPDTSTGGGDVRQRVEPGGVDRVVRAAVADQLAGPQPRITSTASSSISRRTSRVGQASPRMCSLSASPVPTPSENRPSNIAAVVAAACATTAGWIRTIGAVTAVVQRTVEVRAAIAPSTLHTKGDCPCASFQGW